MKIQYKLLLMLILAFGMVIFSEQDCFAFESKENIPTDIPCYDAFMKNLPDYQTNFIVFSLKERNTDNIRYCLLYIREQQLSSVSDNFHYRFVGNSGGLHFLINTSNVGMQYMSCKIIDNKPVLWDDSFCYFLQFSASSGTFEIDPLFETLTVYYSTSDVYMNLNSAEEDSIFYSPPVNVDKLNLYELNLTDLDYNNQVHQFNLATYTNSPCYNEIMEYYNKNYQYAIYVTDYRRTLTYGQPDNDDSFQYGSYNLSGYIDFLVHDKGVFYYDKSENQMKTGIYQTEATIKPTTEYTKRFYFNAVYSEDSNDPYRIVFDDNGNLGQTYNLNNIYAHFIGSSQTIYYCAENGTSNIATKGIVTRIDTVYYKGYLNPWGNIDKDKVRDISTVPFYVYNFKFAGGTTNLLFSNSPTYRNDISNIYNDLSTIHNNTEIVPDSSDGGSYIQGIDSTSSTYEPGKVTNDTTDEQDKEHEGGIRVPGVNTEDRSNWTIFDYIKNIFTTLLNLPKTIIQGISSLFNGDDGSSVATSITETTDTITNKFSFKDNMINNANEIRDFIANTQETHKYYLNINHKYLSGNICIIDLSWYEPYKPTVDAFICAFAYLAFIWHMFCIVPNLIHGASAGSYVSEISTYSHTGFGRSTNIHKGGF